MAHGLAAVKELYLEPFAERFAEAGYVVLLFDYRHWGTSAGEPRHQVVPVDQLEDYRSALTYLSLQPAVDSAQLVAWGTSFSGGHVLHLGAFDTRVKAVVSQVAAIDLWTNATRLNGTAQVYESLAVALADRATRYPDGPPTYIPGTAPSGGVGERHLGARQRSDPVSCRKCARALSYEAPR